MQIRTVPEPGATALAADGTQGCLAITWPYAPPHLGIGSTEEILATFDGAIADRHPPTGPTQDAAGIEHPGREGVRLLTWGDPYLIGMAGGDARGATDGRRFRGGRTRPDCESLTFRTPRLSSPNGGAHANAEGVDRLVGSVRARNLSSVFWLQTLVLEDSANLDDPDAIAAEIVEDLRAALEEFERIHEDLAET